MREINKIIVHCSYTKPSMDWGVAEITRVHVDENGWDSCGYHLIIRRDGVVERGRPLSVVGAHAYGHNSDSIGVCLVGGMDEGGGPDSNFTAHQYQALVQCVHELKKEFGNLEILGHRDVSDKDCPCFDVHGFFED